MTRPPPPALIGVHGRTNYVAAPYGAPTAEERAENVARAGALCRVLVHLGAYPVCLHAAIEAGHYGDDSDAEQRTAGLHVARSIARSIVDSGGLLIALERDGKGGVSPGTRAEIEWTIRSPYYYGDHLPPRVRLVRWDEIVALVLEVMR
jgi:hypothetical protein